MALVFYSKSDCPLCDEGFQVVLALARRHGLDVRKVSIETAGPAIYQRHRYRIPVLCWEKDGEERELGWGRLRREELARVVGELTR